MNVFDFFWIQIKKYKWWYLLMLQAPVLTGAYPTLYNYSIKLIIDAIEQNQVFEFSKFIIPVGLFIFAELYLNIIWRLSDYAERNCETYVRRNIVCDLFSYVSYYRYQFFQSFPSGTVVSKIKGVLDGYDAISGEIHGTTCIGIMSCTISLISISLISLKLFICVLIWAILMISMMLFMGGKLNHLSLEKSNATHRIMGSLGDCISNIFSILSFTNRKHESENIIKKFDVDFIPKQLKFYIYDFRIQILAGVMYLSIFTIIISILIYLRYNDGISVGSCVFVLGILFSFLENISRMTDGLQELMRMTGDLNASFEIFNPNNIVNNANLIPNLNIIQNVKIDFENVCFGYNDKNILTNFNLHIKPNEKVGLVGLSGAGKTTIISLLSKYLNLSSGVIKIDEKNIAEYTDEAIRNNISLIPQNAILFNRTIMENIRYGRLNATDEEVIEAAKIANVHHIIANMPEKYETIVGERGSKLSGGQIQRIAIARAILKNAPILILDEATSSLDVENEKQIQDAINKLLENNNTTAIVIAHRLSTLRHMDRIVVLENGKIIEEGRHDQLLDKQGLYARLWNMHLL